MPSSTVQKLKIKEGSILLTLHAPADFKKKLAPLPAGVKIITEGQVYSQVHWFASSKAQVEKETEKVLALIQDDVICWIYFPKAVSKIQTDLTRDKGWEPLLAHSGKLAWLNLVAFDETWSAFAFRLKKAADEIKAVKPKERPILEYIDAAAKTIRLPEDLAMVFAKNKPAAAYFNSLSFSNRKEYVEWIVTAKQEATRKNRIDGTLERLDKQWKNPRNL